ncbi:MAG: transglycosylase SLT domain-containing protein [Prevotella sp.]|nr:transglycosylase SLT domain-containing protein [Prevotella sp.]
MKRSIYQFTLSTLLLFFTSTIYAQINNDVNIVFNDEDGVEEVMEIPEAMYANLDSLLYLYHNELYLTTDEACESNGENPYYSDEVYINRLNKMPTRMEMPYNPIVRQFIDRYCTRLRQTVSIMLGSSNFYMPIFEQALASYDLPLELKYLPVIESALNPRAVSRAGATGLWQFMLGTGKQYGLRVNSLVDDRCDPIRSSYAAARFLRDLYRIFGDWTLVIAAYNCGPENVNKAIRRSGGSMDYWKIYPYLPAETRGYVPAFIAANYVMTYYCDHNICPMLATLPEHTDTIMVNKNVSMSTISHFCGIETAMLRDLNPQYRRGIVNGATEPSAIRMTPAAINKFIELEDSIYAYEAIHGNKRSYVAVDESKKSTSTKKSTSRSSSSHGKSSSSSASSASGSSSRYGRSSRSSGNSGKSSGKSRRR